MDIEEEKRSSREKRSRSRRRRSRSRSKKRYQRSISRSRSPSPFRRNRGRFGRRSPPFRGGRNFRGRFGRRSRSLSRGRFDRKDRRFDSRRSRSNSPSDRMDNYRQQQQQQQQQQQMNYQTDPYGNYMQGVVPPQAPTFGGMNQFNSYDFQGNYPPPAPNFSNISCPAPPGMGDSWIPQQSMAPTMPLTEESEEDKKKREAAIAEEKKRQREGLKMQCDQYVRRAEKMKLELKVLKDQKTDLLDGLGKRSPSPKTNGFIKENEKLQSEISLKLSEILNVIDMLSGIIGKDEEEPPKKKPSKRSRKSESDDSSPERIKSELLESMKRKKKEAEERKEKINYIYYDNELHWCKHCQVFPKTAKDYLNHLHTKEHLDKIANRSTEGPWRSSFQKNNEVVNYPDAPTEKLPIKGLQFFEPSTAWFCKLCEMFMGDSWCVSLHLKSDIHAQRYNKLIEREPKFEEKWLEARNKAYELSGVTGNVELSANNSNDKNNSEVKKLTDKKSKKKKNKKDSKKKKKHGKKRKRNSSSSSSDSEENSDSSSGSENSSKRNDSDQKDDAKSSIRIAMRNISNKGSSTNENDERTGKWTMVPIDANKPLAPPAPTISANAAKEIKKDEQIIGQWSTVEPIISQEEKRLLENLKGRLKTSQKDEEKQVEKNDKFRDKERVRSRSRERNRADRNYRNRRSRSKSNSRNRKSRSNSRGRRSSRSNSRRRSRSRNRYGRRRFSRSRSRGRYEKSSVSFAPEPKLPPFKDEKKREPSRSYSSSTKKEGSSSLASVAKKMPFIGKMPVFKKQLVEKKNEDQSQPEKKEQEDEPENNNFRVLTNEEQLERNEKWDELMPEPAEYSAMMIEHHHQQQQQQQQMNEEEIDAPPGLDAVLDYEDIPKPISDAPPLKTGPLPKDFQATLDLLFDGDKAKKVVIEPPPPIEVPQQEPLPIASPGDGPQMILAEDLSQHAILYGNFFPQSNNVQPVPPPPPNTETLSKNDIEEVDDKNDSIEMIVESSESAGKSQEDLEDLALLGIDVNDVGSGLW